jgi:hypothetical protein
MNLNLNFEFEFGCVLNRLEWDGQDADEFAFRWNGCGSVEYIRVSKDFVLTRENVRNFLAQNYTRFIYDGGKFPKSTNK